MIALKVHKGKIGSEHSEFVIHPIFDAPEEKLTGEGLGRITMSPSVRISLFLLRAYVFAMLALLGYHVLDLAGAIAHTAH